MRTVTLILALYVLQSDVRAETVNHQIIEADGTPQLLGPINAAGLSRAPFRDWYHVGVAAYEPDQQVLAEVADLEDYRIQVFMGTWCGDSQREVPKLMKILEALKFPEDQLNIVAVNRSPTQFKQSPGNEDVGKNIHRVPTIIVLKQGKEVNRIIETPVESLERDLQKIATGSSYTPNYEVVAQLEASFQRAGVETIAAAAQPIAKNLAPWAKNAAELAAYGYVNLYQGRPDKAFAIFEINQLMFPAEALVYEGLATAHYSTGDLKAASEHARQALKLNPDSESARQLLANIAAH